MPKLKVRYENKYSIKLFTKRLKSARRNCGITRVQMADKLSVNKQQIIRYETETIFQLPTLEKLVLICHILQVEPNFLLNFEKLSIDEHPELGVIYEWDDSDEVQGKQVNWRCNSCKYENISYLSLVEIGKSRNVEGKIVFDSKVFECENCFIDYDKLESK